MVLVLVNMARMLPSEQKLDEISPILKEATERFNRIPDTHPEKTMLVEKLQQLGVELRRL